VNKAMVSITNPVVTTFLGPTLFAIFPAIGEKMHTPSANGEKLIALSIAESPRPSWKHTVYTKMAAQPTVALWHSYFFFTTAMFTRHRVLKPSFS